MHRHAADPIATVRAACLISDRLVETAAVAAPVTGTVCSALLGDKL